MSMKIGEKGFKERIGEGIDDVVMRGAVSSAQERLYARRMTASEELGNWEMWRELGEEIRQHTLAHLDQYLYQLSEKVSERGGHVFFAKTKEEASAYIQDVAQKKAAKKIVKSKSMVTEEIEMNQALEALGCEVLESDLGEYILQVDDHEPPSHIVAPALHMTKEQIRDVFHEKLGYEMSETPEDMTRFVRTLLRKSFLEADIGVTGCNFAVANTGSICLVTNEGNADLVTAIPKTHIAVMGMERLVPSMEELDVLVGLLCRSAVGQKLTSYISVVGPRGEGEIDGPEEFHLVIVDNGRSDILGTAFQSVLQCIRCAACINVCPVYRHVGGHSYGSIYPGPIGAVLSPLLGGYDDYQELPFASSLCAACTDACPVKIPLHELLIKHRQVIVEKEGRAPKAEMMAMKMFGLGASTPQMYHFGTKVARVVMNRMASNGQFSKGKGPLKNWTDIREFPAPSKERFRDWFKKKQKGER
ncbi:LutB/LldF family L-lactate oxidation iron-sulfur protein [Bacillus sp. NPDC093026]|uniref:LutB/LldF family L-lactate oxidation iron-sulfur protein n=1 Tax=Bacillus sp. NPDC093026 TaxID=3363948 RepID=UPI0037F2A02B